MNKSKLLAFALALLSIGNVCAEEVDTLKIVDVEEVLIIAAPKENRKLRELPNAVTLLSQQDMQAAQVNSIKNLTALVPNIFIPDFPRLYPRYRLAYQHPFRRIIRRQYTLYR